VLNRELFLQEFGILLAGERRRKRLSQSQFAARVGLSRTSVTNIECGRQGVQLHQVYLFASALQIDMANLLPKDAAEVKAVIADGDKDKYLADVAKMLITAGNRKAENSRAR
jgi:transcriptional regulator with XRE-family HTH domain